MKINRPNLEDFKSKALKNADVKTEYDALTPLFSIKKQLIATRLDKGITQEQIAEKIGTSKSNISRLESLNNTYMPNLGTLIRYAEALGFRLNIGLR